MHGQHPGVLELDRSDVPDYTTLNKPFDRFKMWVWWALLRVSAQQHPPTGYVVLDNTFLDRGHAAGHYLDWSSEQSRH